MFGLPLSTIVSVVMFFVGLFVSDKQRRQMIEDNLVDWFKKKSSKGEETAQQMTEIEKQLAELRASRPEKSTGDKS